MAEALAENRTETKFIVRMRPDLALKRDHLHKELGTVGVLSPVRHGKQERAVVLLFKAFI